MGTRMVYILVDQDIRGLESDPDFNTKVGEAIEEAEDITGGHYVSYEIFEEDWS